MGVSLTFTRDSVDEVIDDLRRIFPHLALPVTASPPTAPLEGEVLPPSDPAPSTRKPRATKPAKEPEIVDAKPDETKEPVSESKDTQLPKQIDLEEKIAEVTAEKTADIPDIEDVRAKLKTLGATDGLGHDKVFEVLGKYGAKNASTVPDDKRAALIAEIDTLLAGVKS